MGGAESRFFSFLFLIIVELVGDIDNLAELAFHCINALPVS